MKRGKKGGGIRGRKEQVSCIAYYLRVEEDMCDNVWAIL